MGLLDRAKRLASGNPQWETVPGRPYFIDPARRAQGTLDYTLRTEILSDATALSVINRIVSIENEVVCTGDSVVITTD